MRWSGGKEQDDDKQETSVDCVALLDRAIEINPSNAIYTKEINEIMNAALLSFI